MVSTPKMGGLAPRSTPDHCRQFSGHLVSHDLMHDTFISAKFPPWSPANLEKRGWLSGLCQRENKPNLRLNFHTPRPPTTPRGIEYLNMSQDPLIAFVGHPPPFQHLVVKSDWSHGCYSRNKIGLVATGGGREHGSQSRGARGTLR